MTPAAWVGLHARRYMETYGVTNADFGRIAVVDRLHAATNPGAWFYERPITLEDHQASRWIVEPVLRLLDCCQESDGGVALVVTSAERARDLRQPPAVITAAAQGATFDGEMMTSYYRDDLTGLPEMGVVGRRLWEMSGLGPADMSTAFLYDHFTPFVLMQLEELGFCGRGEAKDWATVERLSLGGELPINTSGGLLGEAYIHGMNGITEVVRQIRGTVVQPGRRRRARARHRRNRCADERPDPLETGCSMTEASTERRTTPGHAYAVWPMVLLALVNLVDQIDMAIVRGVLPILEDEWHLSDLQLGSLGFAFVFVNSAATIPAGWLADRVRRTQLMGWTLLSWSGLIALSATAVNYLNLLFARAVMGIGQAIDDPASTSLLGDFYPSRMRGRVFSLQQVSVFVGGALGLGLGGLVGSTLGWRWAFALVGMPGSIVALLVFRLREPRRGRGRCARTRDRARRQCRRRHIHGIHPTAREPRCARASVPSWR